MIEIQPLHADSQVRLLNRLMATDPAAAVTRAEELKELFRGKDANVEAYFRGLHTATLNLAGRYQDAATEWLAIQSEIAQTRLPLPKPGTPRKAEDWTALQADGPVAGASADSTIGDRHQLLYGPPGSVSEFVGYSLGGSGVPVLTDRFTPQPPNDFMQSYAAIEMLDKDAPENIAAGAEIIDRMSKEWQGGLAQRGAPANTPVTDALLLWDNNFLQVLRAHPQSAQLLFAIRDPRDMLLQWLAFPETMVYQFNSPTESATWLAAICNQIADVAEQDLFPHRLIKLDQALTHEQTLADALTAALGKPVAPLDLGLVQGKTFAPGHWRQYQPVIGEAFDILKAAAVRLGYPEA